MRRIVTGMCVAWTGQDQSDLDQISKQVGGRAVLNPKFARLPIFALSLSARPHSERHP
jgi:hypothetical protein